MVSIISQGGLRVRAFLEVFPETFPDSMYMLFEGLLGRLKKQRANAQGPGVEWAASLSHKADSSRARARPARFFRVQNKRGGNALPPVATTHQCGRGAVPLMRVWTG